MNHLENNVKMNEYGLILRGNDGSASLLLLLSFSLKPEEMCTMD